MRLFALSLLMAVVANAQNLSFSSRKKVGTNPPGQEPAAAGFMPADGPKPKPLNKTVSFSSERKIGGNWIERAENTGTVSFGSAAIIG